MFGFLMPKEGGFFDRFEEQAELTARAAELFAAVVRDGADRSAAARDLHAQARQADEVAQGTLKLLHETFITPLERGDIHRLAVKLDSVSDHLDGAARRLVRWEVGDLPGEIPGLAEVARQATHELSAAIRALRDMKDPRTVLACREKVSALEQQSDELYADGLARLFKDERDPIRVIKLREVFAVLEEALDACEDAGRVLEGVVLEHV